MHELANQRADCAAGLDGPFRAERSAGTDGDGRRDGLQQGDPGSNAAAIDQHRFHGFGDAVASDLLTAIASHDADNDAADDRDENHPNPKMIVACAAEGERESVKKEDVGEQPDQVVEHECDEAREEADAGGQHRNQRYAESNFRSRGMFPSQVRRVDAINAESHLAIAHDCACPVRVTWRPTGLLRGVWALPMTRRNAITRLGAAERSSSRLCSVSSRRIFSPRSVSCT